MRKNPFRFIGILFTAIAAIEAVVILVLLLLGRQNIGLFVLPIAIQCPIFGGIGIGFWLYQNRKKQAQERLLANGYYETATVVAIERNNHVRINSRCPYYVVCRFERDGVVHEYRSNSVLYIPALNYGDPVKVYLDRQDEKNYYVDIESAEHPIVRH